MEHGARTPTERGDWHDVPAEPVPPEMRDEVALAVHARGGQLRVQKAAWGFSYAQQIARREKFELLDDALLPRTWLPSTLGRRRHRASNFTAESPRAGSGRNSATGRPSCVTVTDFSTDDAFADATTMIPHGRVRCSWTYVQCVTGDTSVTSLHSAATRYWRRWLFHRREIRRVHEP